MTFKIKQTTRSADIIEARFRRLAEELRVARPSVACLFAKKAGALAV